MPSINGFALSVAYEMSWMNGINAIAKLNIATAYNKHGLHSMKGGMRLEDK